MKRPSFQFYPADWSANPNLKRCTFAEKGIWLEVMCLLHDQAEYGVLRWPLLEIATAVKCRVADLRALQRKGVMKGDDDTLAEAFVYTPRSGRKDGAPVTLVPTQEGPIWFSSRMVKDEYVRGLRADGGAGADGTNTAPKATPDPAPKPPFGVAFGPRTSSSPSSEERSSDNLPLQETQSTVNGAAVPSKGSRLKADWSPGHDLVAYAASHGIDASETERIAEDFRDYWTAQPGQKGVKLDWSATWRRWVRTQLERRPKRAAPKLVGFV